MRKRKEDTAGANSPTPKRRRDKSHPTSVASILDSLKATTALGTQLEQARIWEEWPALAGARLSPHGFPVTVKDGTLYIEADNTVAMHQFAYQKWKLIQRINRLAQKELISDIFILLQPEDEKQEEQS